MKYKTLKQVPATLKASLVRDLKLINEWQGYYEQELSAGRSQNAANRAAWFTFKKKYKKEKGKWALR